MPYPGNSRLHDTGAIAASLTAHGQLKPLIVQTGTEYVLAGNGTLEAMLSLGWTMADVHYVTVSPEQAKRIVLVDNRTYDLGGYDDRALAALLQSLDGLEGTGYDEKALDDLLSKLELETTLPPQEGNWSYSQPNRGPGEDPHPGQASSSLREVLLLYNPEDLARFRVLTEEIRKSADLQSTSAAVLYALELTVERMNMVGAEMHG